jgi:repressor LexA
MKKPGISPTRQRIFKYIQDFFEDKGYAPTVRDILRGCSISSTAVVQHHLNVLEKEGRIHRDPEVFRSIQLANKTNLVRIPLLGTIAAGTPIPVPGSDTWETEALETLELTDEITQGKELFALKVKGFSMIDAYISDGDIVLLQPVHSVNDGDMVAAWLKEEQEVTLKKLYRDKSRIRLQPANSQMEPIFVDPDNIDIQGKVVGVIRKI